MFRYVLRRSLQRLAAFAALAVLQVGTALAQEEEDGRTLQLTSLTVQARLDARGRLHVRERQALLFDGAWNGGMVKFNVREGQEFELDSITRIDPATGRRAPLVEGDLDQVDEYGWDDGTLRWRSRLETDPPFANQEMVYELAFTLYPVLLRAGDGGYRLQHDFAFSEHGEIGHFQVDLTLDSVWTSPYGRQIREEASPLQADRPYNVTVPLQYVGDGEPLAAPPPAPLWTRAPLALGALLIPFLAWLGVRARGRDLDRAAPLTPPEAIDDGWLEERIFAYPAEVVGTAWDRDVGQAEVAALLARLVEEGKLRSRVEEGDDEPVLHLRRLAPLGEFAAHERALLEGLFFRGDEETDTEAVRKHYKDKGYDPAATIRDPLLKRLGELPGEGRVKRSWLLPAAVTLGALLAVLLVPDRPGKNVMVVLSLVLAAIAAMLALSFASLLSRRVTNRSGLTVGLLLALSAPALLLALVGWGLIPGETAFYRPGSGLLLSMLVLLAGIATWAVALARPTETAERLAFRRHLVSARNFFQRELEQAEPRLQDSWFPYLLAFGLGTEIDRWFRAFAGDSASHTSAGALGAAMGSGAAARTAGGWTGGGPQFGGGQFGGGGAGGAWGVAAAGMAAGVAAPGSTGGGGGGVAVSGGGARGGW